ncbi:MAG: helix-turn-helix transcriptional regulator [Deltaproteobacteria bacterium]|nr:helix-turn-helix transcriptional regulator [Deltaproteobacteria bacterium]
MKNILSSEEIGRRVKQRRRELGLSQEELGEMLHVSYQQIQRYENGTNMIGTDKLQFIANLLDVPIGYFFEEPTGNRAGKEVLTINEARLLRLLRNLNERHKKALFQLLLTRNNPCLLARHPKKAIPPSMKKFPSKKKNV